MTPDTLARAAALGVLPRAAVDDNDAYGVLEALGDLVVTGPTLTNVNDFPALVLWMPRQSPGSGGLATPSCRGLVGGHLRDRLDLRAPAAPARTAL